MPNYSLAIFDFDGTLADSFPWFIASLDQTSEHFGLNRVQPDEIESLRELSSREALNHLRVPMLKLPAISVYMRNLFAEGIHDIPLFPGASETLFALHEAGVKLALVSSNTENNVRHVLGPAADIVDHYACGSSLWGKAEKFKSVLRTLRQSPARTIGIGDEIRDIDAARKAGLSAGSITFGYNSRKALAAAHPDFLFDDYDAVKRAVLD
ncbi:MAG: HAD family hydrolase [Hyphomicrobiales bacterium]|nr:MAG: HAD family hydrolase [Hyphomicrobiales bacterium]